MLKASDRLTQLQECVNKLTELLFISVGVLQRDAPLIETNSEIPVSCWTKEQTETNWKGNKELAKSAAKDIVHIAKVIDFLIENLPGQTYTEEEQLNELVGLESQNEEAENDLNEAILHGEEVLLKWKGTLDSIMNELT